MRNRLQNTISQSEVTLPVSCIVASLLWWFPLGGFSSEYLLGWFVCMIAAYVVSEIESVNQLLRVTSSMIVSLLLLLMAACGFLHPLQTSSFTFLAVALMFYCLLRSADSRSPQVDTLHAYFFLSLGSLFWPPLLLLIPVVLWCQLIYLRVRGWQILGAAVCGSLVPFLFWAAILYFLHREATLVSHLQGIVAPCFEPFYWQWVIDLAQSADWHEFWNQFPTLLSQRVRSHPTESAALAYVGLLGLTGFVHYVRRNYDDKIRVRMGHYCFLFMQLFVALWLALQPHYFRQLFPLLVLTTVPSAAHFFTFTRTWVTNSWFVLLMLALVAVAVCTLFLPGLYGWLLPQSDLPLPSFFQLQSISVHLPL